MQVSTARVWSFLLCYFVAQAKAYSVQGWPAFPQAHREYYNDDDYYYPPKAQHYYDYPPVAAADVYGQVPYPLMYDQYGYLVNEGSKRQEERLAALPIGQETWFESEASPRWRSNNIDDVNAAFLDNLILTQMAQEAQRRRENSRAAFQQANYDNRESEDEDVKELKALAGKPLYHEPKTVPRIEEDDYPADDGFINWNGNKRSFTTAAPSTTTANIQTGQKEVAVPRPARQQQHENQIKRNTNFYDTLAQMLAQESAKSHIDQESSKSRRIDKRFVSGDSDLVVELRGLKHRIHT